MSWAFPWAAAWPCGWRSSTPAPWRKLVVVDPGEARGLVSLVSLGHRADAPQAAEAMKPTPIYKSYAQIAPNPKDWPTLITKVFELAGAITTGPRRWRGSRFRS